MIMIISYCSVVKGMYFVCTVLYMAAHFGWVTVFGGNVWLAHCMWQHSKAGSLYMAAFLGCVLVYGGTIGLGAI